MDIQYILDAHACCMYIIDYINKGDRGLSETIYRIFQEHQQNNTSLNRMLRDLTNAQYNTSEVSAQEAAYNLLRLLMSMATSACIYIPTSPPEERQRILKPASELRRMSSESTECFQRNILHHYTERPASMDNTTLTTFAAWYNYSKSRRQVNTTRDDDSHHDDADNNDTSDDDSDNDYDNVHDDGTTDNNVRNVNENANRARSDQPAQQDQTSFNVLPRGSIELQNGDGFIHYRKSPKVIRFRGYRLAQDPLNYYRELVMLYFPWRYEEIDLLWVDCQTIFHQNQEGILANRQEFTTFDDATLMTALENVEIMHDDPEQEDDPQQLLAKNPVDEYELGQVENEQNVDVMAESGAYEPVPYQEIIVHPERLKMTNMRH